MVVDPPGSARAWKLFKNQAVNLVDPEKGLPGEFDSRI